MKHVKVSLAMCVLLFLIAGCQQEGDVNPVASSIEDELSKSEKARPKTMIWADGMLYESVVTPAVFDGDHGNYDRLYLASQEEGPGLFKDGVALISESKPGDRDYNGGRWDLYILKESVAPDKYANADDDGDLDINDFMHAGMYFECPLLPRRGNN